LWAGERGAVARRTKQHEEPIFPFFLICDGATQPVLEPAVMALSITIELNPTPLQTGGDIYFQPAVMGAAAVVEVANSVLLLGPLSLSLLCVCSVLFSAVPVLGLDEGIHPCL